MLLVETRHDIFADSAFLFISSDLHVLLSVPSNKRQVENERHPVAVDQEQDSQERVDTGLGNDVHVQAVAEVDGVDVVAFQIRVHDGEEHLEEEVDGIEQDSEEKQPGRVRLASARWLACSCTASCFPYQASPVILAVLEGLRGVQVDVLFVCEVCYAPRMEGHFFSPPGVSVGS